MVTDQARIASLYAGLYRTIFLLCLLIAASVREDEHRLVFAVGFGDGFDRSGGHLQAGQFIRACTRGGAQRRPRFGIQRNRAWPRSAHTLSGPFVPRLSDWDHRY